MPGSSFVLRTVGYANDHYLEASNMINLAIQSKAPISATTVTSCCSTYTSDEHFLVHLCCYITQATAICTSKKSPSRLYGIIHRAIFYSWFPCVTSHSSQRYIENNWANHPDRKQITCICPKLMLVRNKTWQSLQALLTAEQVLWPSIPTSGTIAFHLQLKKAAYIFEVQGSECSRTGVMSYYLVRVWAYMNSKSSVLSIQYVDHKHAQSSVLSEVIIPKDCIRQIDAGETWTIIYIFDLRSTLYKKVW